MVIDEISKKMKNLLLVYILVLSLSACSNVNQHYLLVEAESFKEKGGWVVDPQFVFQMGSPYLLAHGLGKPVENAKTLIEFSATGYYHVWVRTKNWAPGGWDAPGRFRVIIDGTEIQKDLGNENGWGWQYVDRVKISKTDIGVELKDLTGFEGRCDAIYFCTEKDAPPNEYGKLENWRNEQLYGNDTIPHIQSYDLVIVGGGLAGCGASVAAAEQGLKVALIQDRPVLGGNSSSEIRVHTLGITWKYDRILKMLNTEHWPNGSPDAKLDEEKRHLNIERYKNISLFLNWKAFRAETIHDSIVYVDAKNNISSEIIRFKAPLFADCTGDGWIGYWAGADYMYGREDSTEFSEHFSTLKDKIHSDFFHKEVLKRGDAKELLIPSKKDFKVMGTSVLWRTKDASQPVTFPSVPWATDVVKDYSAINGEWYWEYSFDSINQIDNGEIIRDHMLKAIYGSFSNAKKDTVNKCKELEWVSFLLGKRESRRLIGDYIYTVNDAKDHTEFEDAVVMETRDVDVHYQQNLLDKSKPDFLSDALYYKAEKYFIPYRCLYTRKIKNLFMAGRCFSSSHLGLGGPRVMNTTGQMGCAVGYASTVCIKHNVNPRMVYVKYLDELKELINNSNAHRDNALDK
jgi:hypothetical protein